MYGEGVRNVREKKWVGGNPSQVILVWLGQKLRPHAKKYKQYLNPTGGFAAP